MSAPLAFTLLAAAAAVPTPAAHFNDWAGFVSADGARRLDARLAEYQRTTGHHVVVAVFPSLPDPDMEGFTVRTAQEWGVGRAGKDDGVVLFVFAAERRLRIEVGYGLEGAIPDARAKAIIENVILPRLRQGQPDAALEAGTEALMAAADGRPIPAAPVSKATPRPYRPPPTAVEVSGDDLQGFLGLPIGIGALTVLASRRAQAQKRKSLPTGWVLAIVGLTVLLFSGLFFFYDWAVRLAAGLAGAGFVALASMPGGEKDRSSGRRTALAPAGLVMAAAAIAPAVTLQGATLRSWALQAVIATLLLIGAASTKWWWLRLLGAGEAIAVALAFWQPDTYLVALVAWPPAWLLIGYLFGGVFMLLGLKPQRWWIPETGSWSGSGRGYTSRGGYSSSSGSSSSSYSGGGGSFGGGGASGRW